MPSKTQIQQLQSSRFSESRKKLDGFCQIETGNSQFMENAVDRILQSNENSSEMESKTNSRDSLAWDNAFFTSPGILEPEDLFRILDFQEMEHRVEMPRMVASETFEQEESSRDLEFNSRRSLAWDSAFFTSAGVLDPEELSIVNKGFKEFGTDLHPGVGERNCRSAKSNSKINGDGHGLASLEIDLLDDLKASLHILSKASNATISGSRQGRGNNLQNTHSLKLSDASSQVRMKSTPASRRQNMNMNKPERIGKDVSLPPRAQSKILYPVNSPTTAVTKRTSVCSKHIKLENNATKAASGQRMSVTKRPCLGNSCTVIPESVSSLKSPSSGSHATTNVSARRSCGLSKSAGKSPLKFLRGKFDPRMTASCSFSPLRYSPGNKNEQLFSSPKSSESSASINRTSDNSIESLDSTPCKEISFDSDASQASNSESHLHDQHSYRNENQDASFHERHVNKFSTRNSPVLTDNSRHIRSSGLRMPSPKIGFFDAENSPKGDLKYQFGAHRSCCKTGNQNGAANGTTRSKLHLIRDSLRTCTPKLVSPLGIKTSHPEKMQNKKSMKRETEPLHILRAKKQTLKENEDSNSHPSENMLQILNKDDKENLCNYHDQVDSLSKHIEAIDLNRDIMIELNKENILL